MDCTEEQLQVRGAWRACAGNCARRELARLHLQPTHSCPALDSLLHSAASLTASTGTIGNNVAAAFSTASSSSFDDFMLFERLCCGCLVAAPSACEATCSCKSVLQGDFDGAAVRQLPTGDSGGPLRRLRHRLRRLRHGQTRGCGHTSQLKKNAVHE